MSGAVAGIPGFSPKDPDDVDLFQFDVTAILGATETVASVTGLTEQLYPPPQPTDPPLAPGAAGILGPLLTLWLSGGLEGGSYVVSVEFVTSFGRTIRVSATLYVGRC